MRELAALSCGHRFRQRGLWFLRALMGHLARVTVVILHGVGGTPGEVRWLISKYNLKRILKNTENDGKSVLQIDYNEIKSRKDLYGFSVIFSEH